MKDLNEIMEELEEMNAGETIERLSRNGVKKDILIKILELKIEGKSSDEIVEKLIEILE